MSRIDTVEVLPLLAISVGSLLACGSVVLFGAEGWQWLLHDRWSSVSVGMAITQIADLSPRGPGVEGLTAVLYWLLELPLDRVLAAGGLSGFAIGLFMLR